ncbi:MAG: discoidin domain-containing protein [Spirochaetota bacterium]|nr:discoidin domain-containing protein [Spirochaetota bacterium]
MRYVFSYLGLLLISSMLIAIQQSYAQQISGSIDTFYQTTQTEREDEPKETDWTFTRGYFLGFKNIINQHMNYFLDFRATKNETDAQETTSLFNTGQFNVMNDIFNGNLGYQLTDKDPSIGSRITTNSWNLSLNSTPEDIPRVRLLYSEDKTYDHLNVHQTDNAGKQLFSGIQYKYQFFDVLLNYNQRESEDFVQNTLLESKSYIGKLDLHKSFWGNILLLNSDLNWSRETSNLKYNSDITVPEERNRVEGLYLYDTTPLLDEMNEIYSLIDGDDTISAGIDIGSTGGIHHNIGVDLNFSQECDTIYLYTTTGYDPSISDSRFIWEVYYSDDGINWSLITDNASFSYETFNNRFEIDFPPHEGRYFKVVNTDYDDRSFVGSIYITEIEILGSENRIRDEEDSRVASRWGINCAATLRPMKKLTLGYNFSCDYTENDPGSNYDKMKKAELSHRANITYDFHRYLSSSASYWIRTSDSETSATDERNNKNSSYSLQFNSSPLTTLNMSVSFNHSESEEKSIEDDVEEEKIESESNSYLLYITAVLWEGVDLSSNYNITQSENSTGTETTVQTINLDLRTKLTDNITLDSGCSYNEQKSESIEQPAERTESTGLNFILRYSPSSIFYLSADSNFNKTETETDSSYGFNMSWLPTDKIQINFNSKYKVNDNRSTSYNLESSWNISRYMIFKSGLNYSITKGERRDETRMFYTRLSARF